MHKLRKASTNLSFVTITVQKLNFTTLEGFVLAQCTCSMGTFCFNILDVIRFRNQVMKRDLKIFYAQIKI